MLIQVLKMKSFGYLDTAPRTGVDCCSLSTSIICHLGLDIWLNIKTGRHTDLSLLVSSVTTGSVRWWMFAWVPHRSLMKIVDLCDGDDVGPFFRCLSQEETVDDGPTTTVSVSPGVLTHTGCPSVSQGRGWTL